MKTVFPDLTDKAVARMARELGQLRKLTRYWGTEVINGVEVFTGRKYFYPRDRFDESTKKLGEYLGISKDLNQKMEGVRSAWLYLNPSKASDITSQWDSTILAENLNKALESNVTNKVEWVTVPATPEKPEYVKAVTSAVQIPVKLQVSGKFVSWDPETQVLDTVSPNLSNSPSKADIKARWESDFSVSVQTEDSYISALVLCALYTDAGSYLTIEEAVDGFAYYSTTSVAYWSETQELVTTTHAVPSKDVTVVLTLSEPLTAGHPIVSTLVSLVQNPSTVTSKALRSSLIDLPEEPAEYASPVTFTGNYWYSHNGKTYLRADILTSGLKRKELVKYFTSCMDSGHREKKLKWYHKAIAFVIIAVAVYVAGPAGGATAAATFGGVVTVIAVTISVAALYVAIAMYALAKMGRLHVATAMGQFMNSVDLLIKFAALWTLFASLSSIVQEGLKRAAVEEGRRRVTDVAIEITKVAIERITGATSVSNISLEHVAKMTSFVFDIYTTLETRRLEKEIKSKQKELDELRGQEEQSRVNDILKDLIIAEPELLKRDNSVYAELYDLPYEWWSTPYHTGCIQANTVEGLWRVS